MTTTTARWAVPRAALSRTCAIETRIRVEVPAAPPQQILEKWSAQ
jgi:hypothetical protein